MKPQTSTQGEMWRYTAIPREPRILTRPDGWFLPDEYVACRIWEIWTPARIIELRGGDQRSFMLCAYLGKRRCDPGICDSGCDDRFWADFSRANVLGKKDLLQVLLHPDQLEPVNPYCGIDYELAGELLDMIFQSKEKQN